MKLTQVFAVLLIATQPTFAKTKKVTAAPEAPAEKPSVVPSSISVRVQTISNGTGAVAGTATPSGAARATTSHNSGIQIGVSNLGAAPETVTVRWFWVGRYEKSRNYFRADDGEKAITLDPKKSENVFAQGGGIESHITTGKSSTYKSGGHMTGWVVTATNAKGELLALRASDSYLEGFASAPPAKQR